MDRFKGHKGITAMVLIFSILILIIIAGISISAIVGDNGVLDNALGAKEQAEVETYTEELEVLEVQAKTDQINDGMSTKEYIDEMKEKVQSSTVFSDNISDADEQITEVNSSTLRVETDEGYVFIITEDGIEYVDSDSEETYAITADDVTIALTPSTWTNGTVLVTVTIDFDTTATIQYSSDGSSWSDYDDNGVTVSTNQTFYVQLVDSDGDSLSDDTISKDIDIIDCLDPVLSDVSIGSVTTSTITVTVDAYDTAATSDYGCSGIDHYEYSSDGGTTWAESSDSAYTFEGLDADTSYSVMVKVVDKAGNETISTAQTVTTNAIPDLTTEDTTDESGEVVEANITFSYNPTDWTNTFVTVTITLSDELQEAVDSGTYVIEYATSDPDDDASYEEYLSSGIIINANTSIYVRLSDSTNSSNYVTGSVSNIDKVNPVVESTEATTGTIKIIATDSTDSDGVSGVSGIVGYYVGTESGIPDTDEFTDCTDEDGDGVSELEVTVEGLTSNTTYYVYVIDGAGNYSEVVKQATEKMPNSATLITFDYDPDSWTNGTVDVKAIISDETAEEYSVQMTTTPTDESSWVIIETDEEAGTTSNTITLSSNGSVYARLYDGTNHTDDYATGTVTMIDKLSPNSIEEAGEFYVYEYGTSYITVAGYTTDQEATYDDDGNLIYAESGMYAYYFSIDGGETWLPEAAVLNDDLTETDDDGNLVATYTFTGLSDGMTYTLYMKAVDNAGNETISEAITGTTESMEDIDIQFSYYKDSSLTEEFGDDEYTNSTVYVLAYTGTDTTYTMQTAWVADGDEIADSDYSSSDTIAVTKNGSVWARLTDGSNYTTAVETKITWIDTVSPEGTAVNTLTNSITFSAKDVSDDSGVSAISGILYYAVVDSDATPTSWTELDSASTEITDITVSGLTQNTTYRVWVKDKAGNYTKIYEVTTGSVPDADTNIELVYYIGSDTWRSGDWTNGEATVKTVWLDEATANSDEQTFTIQMSTDGTTWSETTSVTRSTNGAVYARLWDGTNGSSNYLTGTVTYIDTLAPTSFTPTTSTTTNTITVDASNAEDAAETTASGCSGIATYEFSMNAGVDWTDSQSSSTYTFTDVTSGTYYIQVRVTDAAGNTTKSEMTSATTATIPTASSSLVEITLDPDADTWSTTTVSATATWATTDAATTYSSTYTVMISSDGSTWQTGSTALTYYELGTVYACLYDGTNYGASYSVDVENIDNLAPISSSGSTPTYTYTSSSIKITMPSDMADQTSKTMGTSGLYKYTYSINGGDEEVNDDLLTTTYTFSGLTQNTQYQIEVKAYDKAGNTTTYSEYITTSSVASADGVITLNWSPTSTNDEPYTSSDVHVWAETTSTDGYQIAITNVTTTDESGDTVPTNWTAKDSWDETTNYYTVSANSTVYACFYDGTNYGTDYVSITISYIDKLAPEDITDLSEEHTTNSITVTGSTEDQEATSDNACSGIYAYYFYIYDNTSDDTNYSSKIAYYEEVLVDEVNNDELAEYSFEDLTQSTSYTIYMMAMDLAGNYSEIASIDVTTDTVPAGSDEITFTFDENYSTADELAADDTLWYSGDISVTIEVTGDSSTDVSDGIYVLEYATYIEETDDDGNITNEPEYITCDVGVTEIDVTLTENCVLYARLSDISTSGDPLNSGEAKTEDITCIDQVAPDTIDVTLADEAEDNSISVSAIGTDSLSGVSYYEFQYKGYLDSEGDPDETQSYKIPNDATIYVDDETEEVSYTFTDLSTDFITYKVQVIVYDKAGNSLSSEEYTATTGSITELYYDWERYGWGIGDYVQYEISLDGDTDYTEDWRIYYITYNDAYYEDGYDEEDPDPTVISNAAEAAYIEDVFIIAADRMKNNQSYVDLDDIQFDTDYFGNYSQSSYPYNFTWYFTGTKSGTSNLKSTEITTSATTSPGVSDTETYAKTSELFMSTQYSIASSTSTYGRIMQSILTDTTVWTGLVYSPTYETDEDGEYVYDDDGNKIFVSGGADYAIGTTTMEMFIASWNLSGYVPIYYSSQTTGLYTSLDSSDSSSYGYYTIIGFDAIDDDSEYESGQGDSLYLNGYSLYFANANSRDSSNVSYLTTDAMFGDASTRYSYSSTSNSGSWSTIYLRPVVHLTTDTAQHMQYDKDGIVQLYEPETEGTINLELSYNLDTDWTNESVKVTVSLTDDAAWDLIQSGAYSFLYTTDDPTSDDCTWSTISGKSISITVEKNATLYVQITDGTRTGAMASLGITCIDKLDPLTSKWTSTAYLNSVRLSYSVSDATTTSDDSTNSGTSRN